jgi:hypothetical protein
MRKRQKEKEERQKEKEGMVGRRFFGGWSGFKKM